MGSALRLGFLLSCLALPGLPLVARAQAPTTSAAVACTQAQQARAAGFDAPRLCAVLREFAADTVNFHGLVIERHGVVVSQVYRKGSDKSIYSLLSHDTVFDARQRHDLRSISKSVTSLLWGIALDQRKVPPLDTPVLPLFPQLQALQTDGRESITIAHLLTMSSGLSWNEPTIYNSANDEAGMYWRSSQERYLFDRPMQAAPGQRFNYNGGGTAVLAHILADRVGMALPDYARKNLFAPLGIDDWEWLRDVRGRPLAFSGLRMRPVDVARIGRLLLQRGQWQGRQIVSASWIDASFKPHIATGDGLYYGYQWWQGSVAAGGKRVLWHAGFGNGGQRLFMLPELDLVIVMTAGEYNSPDIGPACRRLLQHIVDSAT